MSRLARSTSQKPSSHSHRVRTKARTPKNSCVMPEGCWRGRRYKFNQYSSACRCCIPPSARGPIFGSQRRKTSALSSGRMASRTVPDTSILLTITFMHHAPSCACRTCIPLAIIDVISMANFEVRATPTISSSRYCSATAPSIRCRSPRVMSAGSRTQVSRIFDD